jgi:hypothetical protein
MDPIESKLDLLMDGIQKKAEALTEIQNITDNQSDILDSDLPYDETMRFIVQMNIEKQIHIQSVIRCDNLFELLLKEIGPQLDADQHVYVRQINALQEWIRRVMDIDVSIRVTEEKNNEAMTLKKAGQSAGPPASTKHPIRKKNSPVISDDKRLIKAYERNAKKF